VLIAICGQQIGPTKGIRLKKNALSVLQRELCSQPRRVGLPCYGLDAAELPAASPIPTSTSCGFWISVLYSGPADEELMVRKNPVINMMA
jgi:hypothetical protein